MTIALFSEQSDQNTVRAASACGQFKTASLSHISGERFKQAVGSCGAGSQLNQWLVVINFTSH